MQVCGNFTAQGQKGLWQQIIVLEFLLNSCLRLQSDSRVRVFEYTDLHSYLKESKMCKDNCTGHFSIPEMKHHDRGNLQEKEFILDVNFRGLESMVGWGSS